MLVRLSSLVPAWHTEDCNTPQHPWSAILYYGEAWLVTTMLETIHYFHHGILLSPENLRALWALRVPQVLILKGRMQFCGPLAQGPALIQPLI